MSHRILIVTGSLPPMECGVGYYTEALISHLEALGSNEISILTTVKENETSHPGGLVNAAGWKIRNIPSLIRVCRQTNPDIIHIQYPTIGYRRYLGINLLPYILRIFYPKFRVFVTLHELFGSPLLGRIRNLITITPAHRIIISNQADYESLPFFLQRKAEIIPLGSSVESLSVSRGKATALVGNNAVRFSSDVILFFGFPFPSKNLESLIDAMRYVKNKRLIIASRLTPLDAYHKKLLEQIHGVDPTGKKIQVIGFQPNDVLLGILQSCFCFVLPQRLPLNTKSSTTLSALINNTPLVGAKGTPAENAPLIHMKNALLLEEMSSIKLAEAIQVLSNDERLYESMANHLRRLSLDYGWDEITKKHQESYERL